MSTWGGGGRGREGTKGRAGKRREQRAREPWCLFTAAEKGKTGKVRQT